MDSVVFSTSIDKNIKIFQSIFQGDNTFVIRRATGTAGLSCVVFFLDGMVNSLTINQSVIRPIVSSSYAHASAQQLAESILQVNDSRVQPDSDALFAAFLYGDTIVFTEGDACPVVVNTKGFALRSSSEPENERVLSGPHEGFTECFMPNLALIRRRLNDRRLKFTFLRLGQHTNTVVCLCWLDTICPPTLVRRMQLRLQQLQPDSILEANELAERIRDHRYSLFPTLGTTERPDVVAAKLLEGRIALLTDGSPTALTAPCLLQEGFQSNDDYYLPFWQACVVRPLRLIGLFLTLLFPAFYIAVLLYHPELLPLRLLLALSAAQSGVPLSVGWEVLLMLIVLEVLRESGARTPGAMGQTMSIVGGLVLGQAAVSAHFVAAPTVIVIAVTAVTGLMVPKLHTATLYLRFAFLAAAAVCGLYGIASVGTILLLYLCGMHSFGLPYLLNLVPRVHTDQEDCIFRSPWFRMRGTRFLANRK